MAKLISSIVNCASIVKLFYYFFYRQSSIVNIVNRQAKGPGLLMSKKVDDVLESGQLGSGCGSAKDRPKGTYIRNEAA